MQLTMAVTNDDNNNNEINEPDSITVGRLVEVASRTWPGINKPGGVARAVEVHFDDDDKNKALSNQSRPT